MVFGYCIVLAWSSYVDFYVLWSSRGDDGQSRRVAMGLLMATEAGDVDGLGRGRCDGRRGVVGGRGRSVGGRGRSVSGRGRSVWVEHGPVQDEWAGVRYR